MSRQPHPLHPALAENTRDTTKILSKAHRWTQLRTNIRRNLKQGHLSLPELLADEHLDNPLVNRMKVQQILMSMPGMHKVRVGKVMKRVGIAETKRIQGLNERQRTELIELFEIDHTISLEAATEDVQRKPNQSFYPPGTDGRARATTPWEAKFRTEEWNDNPIIAHRKRANSEPKRDWRIRFMRELISHQPFAPTRAAKKAGVSWQVARNEIANNPEMAEVIEEARQAMKEKVLEAAWEMGIEGERTEIIYNGEIIGYKRVRIASMTQFVAKALDPETYDSKVRAARITAAALTDPHSERQRMMMEFKDRFGEFDKERQKVLSGQHIIDVEVSDDDDDDDDTDADDDNAATA